MSNGSFKYALSTGEQQAVEDELSRRRKNAWIAWGLWLLGGIFGGHRFYLKDKGGGFLLLFTLGGLGVIWLIDAFTLKGRIKNSSKLIEAEIIMEVINERRQRIFSVPLSPPTGWTEYAP